MEHAKRATSTDYPLRVLKVPSITDIAGTP